MTANQGSFAERSQPAAKAGGGEGADKSGLGPSAPERARTESEIESAIVHQLNGPLTALRLYVGEIGQISRGHQGTAVVDSLQEMVAAAYQETERLCAIVALLADGLKEQADPETAAANGREVIGWWSRRAGAAGGGGDNEAEARRGNALAGLTPREREVLGLVSQGCSNKQGAMRMKICPRTFESHRARLMRKLGARNAADLVRMVFLSADGAGAEKHGPL